MLPQEESLLPPDLLRHEEVTFQTIEVTRGTIQDILEDHAVAGSSIHYEMTFHNRSGFLSELNVHRGQEVQKGDVLARLDTDSLEIDIQRQRIEVERHEMVINEIRRTGGTRFARRNAEMDLEIAELILQQLEDEFEKATITAPVDGEIVFLSEFRIGEFIPGRSIVMIVADPAFMQFEYTGARADRLRYGMEAEIIIDSQSIPARVSMTAATAPAEERDRYRNTVIFSVNNLDDLPVDLRIGTRVRFSIFIDESEDALIIPLSTISTFLGQSFVQVLEDGMRTERDLDIGITTQTHAEVLSGLEEGELLIIGVER